MESCQNFDACWNTIVIHHQGAMEEVIWELMQAECYCCEEEAGR